MKTIKLAEVLTALATKSDSPAVGLMVDAGVTKKRTSTDHDELDNTHNLTSDIDHDALDNTHNLTTDIDHDALDNTHNLTTDIDHDALTNGHNLTTDIDHDALTNTHNLTTDIDHDALNNYAADRHHKQTTSTDDPTGTPEDGELWLKVEEPKKIFVGDGGIWKEIYSSLVIPNEVILWNKLGSQIEVENSEKGLDGEITGSVTYETARFDNGAYLNHTDVQGIDFGADSSDGVHDPLKGCIEFWVKFKIASNDFSDEMAIFDACSAQVEGTIFNRRHHLHFNAVNEKKLWFRTFDGAFIDCITDALSFAVDDMWHLAVVWDFTNTIDGTNRMKIFKDGLEIASLVGRELSNVSTINNSLRLGRWLNNDNLGRKPIVIDNVKVWNYAKTDFSDRHVEGY